jgi:transposase
VYLDRCKTTIRGKTYHRVLLRQSYRQRGKVKHRTIANLSDCSKAELEAIELALRHKKDLAGLRQAANANFDLRQGLCCGSVLLLYDLARRIGLVEALGADRQGKLALWQVLARVIDQGSRLSAVRLAGRHAACDVLGLESFHEDHLYANLRWLAEKQSRIEARLFSRLHPEQPPEVFLYDVTSSYLEGEHNALAAWGYNRDGKPGKQQIVIGLLCNEAGAPLSIEVFAGNTADPKTLGSQIAKAAERFGAQGVTFVGDRGMIKGPQVRELGQAGFHYISAITKPQIQALLAEELLQIELFDANLAEVSSQAEGVRYLLRRNPQRAQQLEGARQSKQAQVARLVAEANRYLAGHPRARVEVALRKGRARAQKLKLAGWLEVRARGRVLELVVDEAARAEQSKLDGCYVLKTDLSAEAADKETVHARYKDLTLVEEAFRTSKTVELEIRPVHVRLEASTRGHALVVMMAYRLVKELERYWCTEDLTVQEGIDQLSALCVTEILVNGEVKDQLVPQPCAAVRRLLDLAEVKLPKRIRASGVRVSTKKKLVGQRPRRSK